MTISDQSTATDVQDQLAKLQAQVAALQDQLKHAQRLATLGTMAAMVAHEFNNILTPIINYAQMARRNPSLATKAVDRAADGGERATTICRALLGMTREQGAEKETVRLADLVRQTLQAMARPPERDMIDLTIDVPDDLTIDTRRIELQQVLLNLLLNARTAVLKRGDPRSIHVWAGGGADGVQLHVRDNGQGIAPEHRRHIFQAFF